MSRRISCPNCGTELFYRKSICETCGWQIPETLLIMLPKEPTVAPLSSDDLSQDEPPCEYSQTPATSPTQNEPSLSFDPYSAKALKWVLIVIVVILFVLFIIGEAGGAILVLAVLICIACEFLNKKQKQGELAAKREVAPVVEKLATSLLEEGRYSLSGYIPLSEVKKVYPKCEDADGSDLVQGRYRGVDIQFCNLKVTYNSTDGEGGYSESTLFRGVFIIINGNIHEQIKHTELFDYKGCETISEYEVKCKEDFDLVFEIVDKYIPYVKNNTSQRESRSVNSN